MKTALDILLTAPEFDLVLAVVGSSARHYPQATVRPIIDSAETLAFGSALFNPDQVPPRERFGAQTLQHGRFPREDGAQIVIDRFGEE